MRKIAHWTPRYVIARIGVMIDQRLRPDDPWLTREAIGLLDRLLKPTDIAIEFGAGRSTLRHAPASSQASSIMLAGMTACMQKLPT